MTQSAIVSRIGRIALAAAVAAAFTVALACAAAPAAHAATTFSKHIMNRAYSYSTSKYDVTGDKKKDKLTIKSHKTSDYQADKVRVYINGKRKLTLNSHYNVDAYLFRIKSGRTFLYIKTYTDNSDAVSEGVYTYKSGKLKKVLNTNIWPKTFDSNWNAYHRYAYISHSGVESIKVSGSTVKIKFYNMTSVAGAMYETFNFKYKSGKLKRTSSTTTKVTTPMGSNNTLTSAVGFYIYSNPNGTGTETFVYYGTKVTLKAVQLRASDHFIAVKVVADGTTGWITYRAFENKGLNSLHYGTLFQETGMAG